MFIVKTILILCVVSLASYALLNYGFIAAETRLLFGLIVGEESYEDPEINNDSAKTFLFPISNERVAAKKTTSSKVSNTVPIKSSMVLSIPSLNISAPIVFEPTTNEDRIYQQLEKGVVHYADTPMPGQNGTSIILGHSSVYPWYKGKYGYVFTSLSKLKTGDIIQIEKDGNLLEYKVSRSLIFSPDNPNDYELRELESTNGSSLVLMTCWPTGTNAQRVAVRADLII